MCKLRMWVLFWGGYKYSPKFNILQNFVLGFEEMKQITIEAHVVEIL